MLKYLKMMLNIVLPYKIRITRGALDRLHDSLIRYIDRFNSYPRYFLGNSLIGKAGVHVAQILVQVQFS